jgi:CubicO group peptidase (beta-lactamase class C family)
VRPLLVSPRARPLVALCMLAVIATACAAPAPTSRQDAAASPAAPPSPAAPHVVAGGPDAAEYGASNAYPIGDRSTYFRVPFLVGSHSHLDEVFEGRLVRRPPTPSPLARTAEEPAIRYEVAGQTRTLDDYLARNPATGFLVARDDTILVERYQYARNDRHRFTSWSMAKTVTAMLVGIAVAEGRIRSVDDPAAAYEPALAGTEYGRTSLRDLLQMSSGVRFVEEYSGRDDVSMLAADTFMLIGAGGADAVRSFNTRAVPAGTKFSYASVETQVLGLVLRRANGSTLASVGSSPSGWIRRRSGGSRPDSTSIPNRGWRGRKDIGRWIRFSSVIYVGAG